MIRGTEVRLTIEGMKAQIVQFLHGYFKENEIETGKLVEAAVKAFDFQAEVTSQVNGCLREMVSRSVRDAFFDVGADNDLKKAVLKSAIAALDGRKDPRNYGR